MVIIHSAKMPLLAPAMVNCAWLLVLAGSLGACQRADYPLQPVASTAQQAVAPAPRAESAVVAMAATPPAAVSVESHQRVRRHSLHRPARPRLARVLAPRVFARPSATAGLAAPAAQRQEPRPVAQPVRYRSRGVAILLAALSLTYLPLGLHNFYLGYYERGAAAIALLLAGLYLMLLGLVGGFYSGAGVTFLGAIGAAMLGAWFIWQITDLVRIITKRLKPKNGEYNARLFQLKSDAGGTTSPPRRD